MPAYVIALITVTDPEGYEEYKALAPATIAKYGGKYVARGGRQELLEGDLEVNRISLLEFESLEQAKRWWSSPEYEEAKPIRQRTASSSLIVVEGL
jgi:uncharacterized protein (DUF1330 family)